MGIRRWRLTSALTSSLPHFPPRSSGLLMDDAVLPWLYLFILHSTSTAKHHCAVTRFGLVSARVGISRSGDNCISLGQISASPLISLQFNLCLWTSCTHWTENRLKAKPKTEQTLALCGVIVEGGWRRQRTALQPESCDHCQSNHFTWEGGIVLGHVLHALPLLAPQKALCS